MYKAIERLNREALAHAPVLDTLTHEQRSRGRLRATSDDGHDVGLFLERGPVLRDGDGVRLEGGEVLLIRAAAEPVATARIEGALALARLCYHLGNRHVPLAIGEDAQGGFVRLQPDHVLEALAERLGARLERGEAPFDPESGAYAEGHGGMPTRMIIIRPPGTRTNERSGHPAPGRRTRAAGTVAAGQPGAAGGGLCLVTGAGERLRAGLGA
ncbi:urease accessory protein [Kushneria sinocarnis]|uniref:Urease accessory protein UreE n=1 Tax=Kushneria sinocarnis TaxID=595502 RepID=A0A420X176_9GAMM|nr:urease accessory protein [Kushneria sinocarnis]